MIKEGEIYFNNRTSLGMNLFLEEYPSIPIANEEYEEMKVEGRNGSLYVNKGTYSDRKISFNFTILSDQIEIDFDEVYKWLTEINDNRLVVGRKDKCFIVKKIIFGDLSKEFRTIGGFNIDFVCEPFRSDLQPTIYAITSSGFKFNYKGNAEAEPLFKVYGNGNVQLTVNGDTMQINSISSYVEIDSKLMQVRNQNGTSKDNDVLGDFPLFGYGQNTINYTGSITKIIVEYATKYK
ncbi:phage tail domain-containing protein [Clostridium cellulovorans]|uniref:Tail component family protein n=1 Tax=Clostridium cellulovorans (strain ATCC 35296 / DSM 3052 / OCM 3 / 743B) TaxID=573061 RepID=D9SVZ7_CLOC7|nr:phage tail domain-containing protein [Clostridium cellulovorans]ADL53208.1 tail component family protein [Clostridium cellulovorans 743B]